MIIYFLNQSKECSMMFKKILLLTCLGITHQTTSVFATDVSVNSQASAASAPFSRYPQVVESLKQDQQSIKGLSDQFSPIKMINRLVREIASIQEKQFTPAKLKDLLSKWVLAQRLHYLLCGKLISVNLDLVDKTIDAIADKLKIKHKSRLITALNETLTSENPNFSAFEKQFNLKLGLQAIVTDALNIINTAFRLPELQSFTHRFPLSQYDPTTSSVGISLGSSVYFESISRYFQFLPMDQKEVILLTFIDGGLLEAIENLANYYGNQTSLTSLKKSADLYRIAIDLGKFDHYYNLAIALSGLGTPQSTDDAIKYYKLAIDHPIQPRTRFLALNNLAALSLSKSAVTEAEKYYRDALRILPQNSDINKNTTLDGLANALIHKGTSQSILEAVKIFEGLCTKKDATAQYNYAKFLESQDNDESRQKSEKLYRQALKNGHVPAANNLASLLEAKGTPEATVEAESLYRLALSKGDTLPFNNLAVLLYKKNTPESLIEAESLYRQAIEHNIKNSLCYLAVILNAKGTPEALAEAELLHKRAIASGVQYSNLLLAKLLSKKDTPESVLEAEFYFKEAVRLNLPDAIIFYADFLKNNSRFDEAETLLQEEDSVIPETSSGSDSDTDEDREETAVVHPEPQTPAHIPELPQSTGAEFRPTMTKKQQRMFDRLDKERERAEEAAKIQKLNDKSPQIKTYRDINVLALPNALREIESNELVVQRLISMLADGETKRGKFESIDHNCYSTRINKQDRLVFQITSGNLTTGVKEIKIISAAGHYHRLANRLEQTTEPQIVKWSNDS